MCICKCYSAGQQQKKGYPKEVSTDTTEMRWRRYFTCLYRWQHNNNNGTVRTRKRTARRSGKLVKRIVAVASLALDGLDLFAHLLSGKVGGATLAIPEGDPRVPVVHHRLGLTEPAVPARVWHGSGVS